MAAPDIPAVPSETIRAYVSIRRISLKDDFTQNRISADMWQGAVNELDRLLDLVRASNEADGV